MKIDQQNIQQNGGAGGAQQTGGAEQVRGADGSRGIGGGRGAYRLGYDSVELSSLSEAVRAYTTVSPARASALSQLGQDVQAGRYQVDPGAVSHAVVSEAFLP